MAGIVSHARLTITRSSHPEFDYFLELRDADTNRQVTVLHEQEYRMSVIHQWLEDLHTAAQKVGSKLTVIDETGEVV
jgi:hypothetical protein